MAPNQAPNFQKFTLKPSKISLCDGAYCVAFLLFFANDNKLITLRKSAGYVRKFVVYLVLKQRNFIIARHVDNFSFNEIGRRMGVTGKTVIAHFKAAEKKIKKYYGICVKNKH
ncbi:MAG: sigma-70 family RNA polymerase sigma factor, partial [Clostridia bacterium]|nr:sigma-70 family RNA polymerase sigma factor [Clostridia bacterium]